MEAIVKGRVMDKEVNDWEMNGNKGKSYTYDLYQKGQLDLVRIKCNEEQHGKVKEGTAVEVLVDVDAKASYGEGVIKCRQKAMKQLAS